MVRKNKFKPSKESKIAYNKIKNNINKDLGVIKAKKSIINIKEFINTLNNELKSLDKEADDIKNKETNPNLEGIIESFPIESLRELYGDYSKKIKFADVICLQKLGKKADKMLEQQLILEQREKIIQIELLQKKIECLINNIN